MSVQVEKLEKSMVKLTIEASAETFEAAVEKAYQKNKNKIALPGFRKGKAPRKMIEKAYGIGVFYEEAANIVMQDTYPAAVEEAGVDVVSRPEIDVVDLGANKPFIYTATVAVRPEVTLGEYKGIAVKKQPIVVEEEEINKELEKEREQNAVVETVTDRAIEKDDIATIDFEGFVDGVAFEGGKGTDYDLVIGSHSFIDTFEDQLIGAKVDDDIDVNVTFPENYQAEDLAGKPALFKVKVKKISCKTLPELDDEFAAEVSSFDTLAEYKESIKEKLNASKEEAAKNDLTQEIIDKVVENSTMEVPVQMIEAEAERMFDDFGRQMSMQGITMEQYIQFTGSTEADMKKELMPRAEQRIKQSLVLEEIVKAEKIEASEEDLDEEFEKMAKEYNMEADKIKTYFQGENAEGLKSNIAINKAVDFLYDNAKIQKARKKAEKKSETAETAETAETEDAE